MADNDHTRVSRVEILPPAPIPTSTAPNNNAIRVRHSCACANWSERRQLESYQKLVDARNELRAVVNQQLALVNEQYRLQYELLGTSAQLDARLGNLPSLREIEERKIAKELAQARRESTRLAAAIKLRRFAMKWKWRSFK